MTMWRPTEPAEEDVSDPPSTHPQSKRRRSRHRAWRDGLADQTVVTTLEHVRSYRGFEHVLIGSVDPRSVVELALVHRLASLLWRLRRGGAIETGLFEIRGEFLLARCQDPPADPVTMRRPPSARTRQPICKPVVFPYWTAERSRMRQTGALDFFGSCPDTCASEAGTNRRESARPVRRFTGYPNGAGRKRAKS
jgi:hypothetical protein